MKSMKERKYFYSLMVSNAILIVIFLITIISSIVTLFNDKKLNDCFFEVIYAAYHFIVLGFALILEMKALRDDSFVIKGLMTINGKVKNKTASIIALVIALVGTILFILFSLMHFNVLATPFNFPEILVLLIINVSLFLTVYGFYFFFYPMIAIKK